MARSRQGKEMLFSWDGDLFSRAPHTDPEAANSKQILPVCAIRSQI